MSERTLTVGSLFSGVGAFDLGMERAGFDVAWQVENDPHAARVLAKHWPHVPCYGDIRAVDPACLEPVDVVVFGSPCQDVSVAGKQAGMEEGTRSGLFFEACRIIRGLRPAPAVAVWENVPGALGSAGGRDFGAVLDALADCGALDIGWRVLDGRYAGVAQRRRRVWLVADFGGQRVGQVLFEPESMRRDPSSRRKEGQGAPASPGGGVAASRDLAQSLTSTYGKQPDNSDTSLGPTLAFGVSLRGSRHHDGEMIAALREDQSAALRASQGGGDKPHVLAFGLSENQRAEVRLTEVSRQMTAGGGKPGQGYPATFDGMTVRRLTPVECLRLMSLPDDWLDGLDLADGPKYRLVGNSLVVNEAAWLGDRLMAALTAARS